MGHNDWCSTLVASVRGGVGNATRLGKQYFQVGKHDWN
jgi:hypothetical protein